MNTSNLPLAPRVARGFTLVESLLATAVAAVLVGAAAPAMTATINSVQLSSASNDLLWGLLTARSEAIKRKSPVVLCKSASGVSCAGTGGWEQGWVVFHDTNNNGAHDSGEAIIQRRQALSAGVRVTGNMKVERYVSYTSTGVTKLAASGTLTLCNKSPAGGEARQIIINPAGRPRVQKTMLDTCA
jgi:type IV fimbrial biogenesis protein FimT